MTAVYAAHDGGLAASRGCGMSGGGACACTFASECGKVLRAKQGVCSERETCSLLCQWALTRKRTLLGGGALERGHGAPFECLAQLRDALGGVGAVAITVEATKLVAGQTAMGRRSVNGR